jgi:hypothetical protein
MQFSGCSLTFDRLCGLVVKSSWPQIQRSWRYQIFREVVGLEQGPLSLASTIEELLGWKSSGSGLEHRDYGLREVSCLTHRLLFTPRKLVPISVKRLCRSPRHSSEVRITYIEETNAGIRNRTPCFPACSTVHQIDYVTTCPLVNVGRCIMQKKKKLFYVYC